MTAEKINDYIFREGEIDSSYYQLELIDRLIKKAELAMTIVALEAGLEKRTTVPHLKSDIQDNVKSDAGEISVLVYQYKRACKNYSTNPHAEFDLDDDDLREPIAAIEKKFELIKFGYVDQDIEMMSNEKLISKISGARMLYVLMSIAENQLHLEQANNRMTQTLFLLKGWDEGILPAGAGRYVDQFVQDTMQDTDDALAGCHDRIVTMRKFMGRVYDMMGENDSPNFKADRFASAPLEIINKLTP